MSSTDHNKRFYTVDSKGISYSLDATTGQIEWSEKLKGKFHSSPIFANGYLYISTFKGETLVYRAGAKSELVSRNN